MAANWFGLGLALGLPTNVLKKIVDRRFNENDRHRMIIYLWLHIGTASWKNLALALCHPLVNRRDIAERISGAHRVVGKLC